MKPLISKSTVNLLLLILTLFLAAFLRLYKLDQTPNGFYVDEAAIGYNAYSLLTTGKDEYGKSFPIFLRSFQAYSSPLYTYLTTISIHFLDLNIFSTRLLSALCGIISLLLVYLILKTLPVFKNSFTPLLGAFLFAISPWNIFFSRATFEANLALTLILLSFLLFLHSFKKRLLLLPSVIFLSLTTYAYQSTRLAAYLLLVGFSFLLIRNRKNSFKIIALSAISFFLIQLPQLSLITTPAFTSRADQLFYQTAITKQAEKLSPLPFFLATPLAFTREFSSQFLAYFSPRNLFFDPDPDPQRSLPDLSVFYPWQIIPFLIGFYLVFKNFKSSSSQILFLLLLAFALVPALTHDPFSALRAYNLIVPFTIIICLGLDRLLTLKPKFLFTFLFLLISISSLLFLWRSYFVFLPKQRAKAWGYGFNQLVQLIKQYPDEKFLIDQSRLKPAYIEIAFFLQLPPETLQVAVDPSIKDNYYTNTHFDSHYQFANIETRPIVWEKDICQNQILVGDEFSISESQAQEHHLTQIAQIRDPLDQIVFQAFRTNPTKACQPP